MFSKVTLIQCRSQGCYVPGGWLEPGTESLGQEQWSESLDAHGCRCCCSIAQLCPTLQPHGLQPPGFPVLHISWGVFKFISIELVMLTISSSAALFSFGLQSFPASGSFPMSQLFTSSAQSIGASASASVLPMHAVKSVKQGFFLLDLKLSLCKHAYLCLNKGNTTAAFPKFFQARTAFWVVHLIRQVSHRAAWLRESNPLLYLNSKLTTGLLGRS